METGIAGMYLVIPTAYQEPVSQFDIEATGQVDIGTFRVGQNMD